MYEFHKDKERYFRIQYETSRDFIIPFIKDYIDLDKQLNILEVGSAEAGVLKAFTELGHTCTGIELQESRVVLAKEFMKEELEKGQIRFFAKDIYEIDVAKDLSSKFDLIILKDVIEHIHDQEKFIRHIREFLNPGGMIFFGFPPWYMPFGGHQQVCGNKLLSKLPYYHLLPRPLYKGVLSVFGETNNKIEGLLEIKDTGISIERFMRIVRRTGFECIKNKYFLFNPIYKFKFGLEPKEQYALIKGIPFFRNFFTTAVYFLIRPKINGK